MTKTTISALLFLVLTVSSARAANSALLISKHSAGPIAIGMRAQTPVDKFSRQKVRLIDLMLEGDLTPALEIQLPGTTRRNAVVAELECRNGLVVSRITVNDRALATARGIAVGMTVGRLRGAYGPGRLISGEGGVGIRIEELAATFGLSNDSLQDSWYHTTDSSVVPASVKISSILLN